MKPKAWCGIYLLSVLIFSGIYHVAWRYSPDSFIVSPHLNIQPILEINDFLWLNNGYEVAPANDINLSELKAKYDSYYNQMDAIETELDALTESQEQIQAQLADLLAEMESDIVVNIESYKRTSLGPLRERERELEREVRELEKRLSPQATTHADVELIRSLGDKRVELAEHRVERAEAEYKVAQYVIDNFSSFVSKDFQVKQSDLVKREAFARDINIQLERKMRAIRSQAFEQIRTDTQRLLDQVGFVDFLYYSIGISTTTTFGDVTANSKVVRGIVSVQLLLCIILISGLINAVFQTARSSQE